MNTLNTVTLIGNLGADPRIVESGDGKQKLALLSLATHERWKTRDGEYEQVVEWHRVVIYNPHLASFAEKHLNKGDKVYLEGKIRSKTWVNSEGQEVRSYEIVIPRYMGVLNLLSKKEKDSDRKPSDSGTLVETQQSA